MNGDDPREDPLPLPGEPLPAPPPARDADREPVPAPPPIDPPPPGTPRPIGRHAPGRPAPIGRAPASVPPPARGSFRPGRRLDFGRALSGGFAAWIRCLPWILLLGAAVLGPFVLLRIIVSGELGASLGNEARTHALPVSIRIGLVLMDALLTVVVTGGVARIVSARERGERVDLGDAFRVGFGRLPAFLPVAAYLAIVPTVNELVLPEPDLTRVMLRGLLVLLLWGVWLLPWSCLCVAIPAAADDPSVGPLVAIRRSAELTAGSRGSILALLVLLVLIEFLAGIAIGGVLAVTAGGDLRPTPLAAAGLTVQALGTTLLAAVLTVVHGELRRIREGWSFRDVADVFA